MAKHNNKPKWVLFDQIHIDVNIRTDISAIDRKDLKNLLNSPSLKSLFESIIIGPHRDKLKVKVSR